MKKIKTFQSKLYDLKVEHKTRSTLLLMTVKNRNYNTSAYPQTIGILNKFLPGIFKSKCFNDGELPFRLEAEKTEIGHLFEHILLEYLCKFKIINGSKRARYAGETSWNWIKEKRGIFHIIVSASSEESEIFSLALERTIWLMNFIMLSNATDALSVENQNYLKPSFYHKQ